MDVILSDEEIERLLKEKKALPKDYRQKIRVRPKRGHKESDLDVISAEGNNFRIILRQSFFNTLDFSIISSYRPHRSIDSFGCVDTMVKAMNILTLLKETHSMISIFIKPLNAIK